MAPARPMLGDVELQQVQTIEVDGDQVLVQHGVPALEGDFLQRLGRRGTQVTLTGVLTGPEAGGGLKALRDKLRAAEPVSFVADITTATRVDQVLIEEMGVRELAGKPERFEYAFTLREFIAPPEPEAVAQQVDEQAQEQASEVSSQQIDNIISGVGILEVQVDIEGGEGYSGVVVVVKGETSDGEQFSAWSGKQIDGVYRFTQIQAGTYTVRVEIQ
jgi:hypothetical protein